MVFDGLGAKHRQRETATPMGIAHNSLLTAREKLDLLTQLKSDATGASQEGAELGFDAEEIDAAIAEVRQGVQDGVGTQTVLKGDF